MSRNDSGMSTYKDADDFYLRFYIGHKGKFGHEFFEFEFQPDGVENSNNWARRK